MEPRQRRFQVTTSSMRAEAMARTLPADKPSGISLIELLAGIGILAIVAAVAAPSMAGLIERQRAISASNALVAHLSAARLTAITHSSHTVLCPSTDGATCNAGTDWSGGLLLFLDRDGNRRPDRPKDIVRADNTSVSRHLRLTSSAGRQQARYLPDGRSAGSNLTISICNMRGELLGSVIVNNTGRIRSTRPVHPTSCPM